jgi:hypothetical protein
MTSTVAKGNLLEKIVFEKLQEVGIKSKRTGGRNDGGIDIRGKFLGRNLIIQCKNHTAIKIGEFSLRLSSYYIPKIYVTIRIESSSWLRFAAGQAIVMVTGRTITICC